MGRPKALIEIDGVALAARVAAALREAGCSPVVVVGDPSMLEPLTADEPRLTIVADEWPGEGPLGGVLTALRSTVLDVVVAACDLADLTGPDIVAVLGAGAAAGVDVAVASDGRRQPSLARWNRTSLEIADRAFGAGERSLRGVLDLLATVDVPVRAGALRDLDTPDDLRRRCDG